MDYCDYCHQPISSGKRFCDETCYSEYYSELNALGDGYKEDLPGESRYAGWLCDEPMDWDVVGGL
jgi:hypothetical protein